MSDAGPSWEAPLRGATLSQTSRWRGAHLFLASRFITILGGLIVFSSWTIKSTVEAHWIELQRDIEVATQIYYPFLSSTYVMNLIQDAQGYFPEGEDDIPWAFLNYKQGLQELARGLPEREEQVWMDSLSAAQDDYALVRYSSRLMRDINDQTAVIKQKRRHVATVAGIMYALGSVLIITGQFREFRSARTE